MKSFGETRWDLGVRGLLPSWRQAFRAEGLRDDLLAALSVALMAVPLSLAIGLASGVPLEMALISAVVAGVVASMFGGTPLAVTGPAALMSVLVAHVVQSHGIAGLVVVTLLSGLLQLLFGVLGLGRLARLVPLPVVEGFTAGIGALLLVGQLPRALGLTTSGDGTVLHVLTRMGESLSEVRPAAVAVAFGSLAVCMLAPRIHARFPGHLVAVVLASLAAAFFDLGLESIGTVTSGFRMPGLPRFEHGLASYVPPTLMVFALGSLESLLSATGVDRLAHGQRHDPDQEFIGQGLSNLGSALFGGMPVMSVIARSVVNVKAGARTRRASFLHALMVLGLVLALSPWLSSIPVAALSGVLMSVALRFLHPAGLLAMFKSSRADGVVYLVTFVLMVTLDLIQGVQWGLGAALLVAAYWSSRHHARLHRFDAVHRIVLEGPLTFLSSMEFDRLRGEAGMLAPGEALVLDLSGVTHVDATGAELLAELASFLIQGEVHVALLGMRDDVQQRVLSFDTKQELATRIAASESDLSQLFPDRASSENGRLSRGVASFRRTALPRYQTLFKQLADSQSPHTLFITCADSRVVPNLITSTDPGELFILRNVGNMVPPFSPREAPATAAGVEYAVGILGVGSIVVCGHSGCGAIKALRAPDTVPEQFTSLHAWLNEASARELCSTVPAGVAHDDVAKMNVLLQREHLRTYAVVREREEKGELKLHAWFFDIGTGNVEAYDQAEQRWIPFQGDEPQAVEEAGRESRFVPAPGH